MNSHYLSLTDQIETALEGYFRPLGLPEDKLREAMRYSLMAGGKRVRPVLTLEFCRYFGGDVSSAMPFACAIEMIHTGSLIHDDLPCMDDDDLRRGKPTNHKVFGEATAVLAGDALLAAAFEAALGADCPASVRVRAAMALAEASGENGMVAGQVLDMEAEGKTLTADELTRLCTLKTGMLIEAACVIGAIAAGADESQCARASEYGRALGLAFQIQDDLLDVEGSTEELGKPVGSDETNTKCTFATCLGTEKCRRLVEEYSRKAIDAVSGPGGDFLREFAYSLQNRRK